MGQIMAETESSKEMMSDLSGMMLFSGNANPNLGQRVADYLGIELGRMTSTQFSDGELRIMIDQSARGKEVFIVQPTCQPANDTLMELLIMLDAFRRASASRINVVMPYYGYARQDKKIKPREPVTARLVADLIQNGGAARVVAVDLHAEQIQGFFNIPVDHLYGGPIIGRYLIEQGYREDKDVVVVSPDVGGVGRARSLAETLQAPLTIIAKRRTEANQVDIVEVIGDVHGKRCIMIDDMIDTGRSIINGAEAIIENGAIEVMACCTHPVFSGDAAQRLQDSVITRIIAMDTVPICPERQVEKLTVLPIAPLLGEAIKRIHLNRSVSTLFDDWR